MTIRRLILALLAMAIAAACAQAGTIRLRSEARVDSGETVALRDVAELEGTDAEALGAHVVISDIESRLAGRSWIEFDLPELREALESAGVNWGRLALTGKTCVIRLGGASTLEPEDDERGLYERPEHRVVDVSGPGTVLTRVARTLATLHGVSTSDLRLAFDEADAAFLRTPESGRRIEVAPQASERSERVPMRVRLYMGSRLAEERAIRVDVEIRRSVVALQADVRRGQTITPAHLREQTRWMKPGGALARSSAEVAGAIARRGLDAGSLVAMTDLESPVVVKRKERVIVRCFSGGVALTARARSLADARVGDIVEMRLEGGEKTFLARVEGPGRAVMDLDTGVGAGAQALAHEERQ